MREQYLARSPSDCGHCSAPVRGHLVVRDEDLGEDRVVHQRHDVCLGADVVVKRHGGAVELSRDAFHGDSPKPLAVGDLQDSGCDLLAIEAWASVTRLGPQPDQVVILFP